MSKIHLVDLMFKLYCFTYLKFLICMSKLILDITVYRVLCILVGDTFPSSFVSLLLLSLNPCKVQVVASVSVL